MARNPLDPFALGIGRLCHEWADLEKAVIGLFAIISGMNDPGRWSMIDCLDFRDVLRAVKVGAVATATSDAEHEWAQAVIRCMNYIDDELRNLRNRYVHDPWSHDHRGVIRITISPRITKPQAFEKPRVIPGTISRGDRQELKLLVSEMRVFWDWTWRLYDWMDKTLASSDRRAAPPGLLGEPPQRLRLQAQSETQYPKGKGQTGRKRPP